MLLFLSDLHADLSAYAWASRVAPRYSALLFGGDAFSSNSRIPMTEQLAQRRKFFAELPIPAYVATGNHDWAPDITDIGEGFWLQDLASKYPHIHGAGLHGLPGGWRINVIDFLEPAFLTAENVGRRTILMQHIPPSGPCSWTHGISVGDDILRDDLNVSPFAPALVCGGHCHSPKAHAWRQGRLKTLVLNPGVSAPGGRPNHFEIDTENESIRWVSGDNTAADIVLPIYASPAK